jgi:hypothetical protein
MNFLKALLGPANQLPHGFCLLWDANLVWLRVVPDAVIMLAYYAIPFGLVYFVRKRHVWRSTGSSYCSGPLSSHAARPIS